MLQLTCVMPADMTRPEEMGMENGIGAMPILGGEPGQVAKDISRIQTYVMEHSRHKIPVLFHCEALAGTLVAGGNQFPLSIGLGAAFDPELVEEMAEINGRQMRAAGIRPMIASPGYKEFLIEPVIGGSLKFAKAVYESPYGTIRSEWKKTDGKTEYLFEIPANTKATIRLKTEEDKTESVVGDYPGATYEDGFVKWEVGSGIWKITV